MCCGLGEGCTRFRNNKKTKKEKFIVAKNGLVGMKGYRKTYTNPVKWVGLFIETDRNWPKLAETERN